MPLPLALAPAALTCDSARSRLLAAFCPGLPVSPQDSLYSPVLWAVFHAGKAPALAGDDARSAFDRTAKGQLLLFYEYDDPLEPVLAPPAGYTPCAAELEEEAGLYLLDRSFSWAYIVTAEEGHGPYFCRRSEPRRDFPALRLDGT